MRFVLACATAWSLSLAAAGGEPGPQLWNADCLHTPALGDYAPGESNREPLRPIELAGARNGSYSGMVVLSSSSALTGIGASFGKAVGQSEPEIPAAWVRVRYALRASPEKSWVPDYYFDALWPEPPAEIRPAAARAERYWAPRHEAAMAIQPLWITVSVPRDAAPGDYAGQLTVRAGGMPPRAVPVRIAVSAFTLPDPADFTVKNLGMTSPDQIARHYKVEPWSDRHFELMGRSMELMTAIGSRQATVNLVLRYPSQDNHLTMVTWVRKPGGYGYDFAVLDRYLDLVEKKIGKPFPVRLQMWAAPRGKTEAPLPVLVRDPATGRTEELNQPACGSPEALAFWKPVLGRIRERLEKRGWFDVAGVNWIKYTGEPPRELVSMFKAIWPDGRWTNWSHGRSYTFPGLKPEDAMPVMCTTAVWNETPLTPYERWNGQGPGPRPFAAGPNTHVWDRTVSVAGHARNRCRNEAPLLALRFLNEEMLMRDHHGVDPVGIDLWPAPDARGRLIPGQWADFCLGPLNATTAILSPGPDGALATQRFEAMREGVQIAETILFLQRALDGKRIGGELAERVNRALDERALALIRAVTAHAEMKKKAKGDKEVEKAWLLRAKWGLLDHEAIRRGALERDRALYALAGEVARALAGK